MHSHVRWSLWGKGFLAVVVIAAFPAVGQEPAEEAGTSTVLEEIVVTGSRLPTDLDTFAGSVTVIDSATLEQQTKITSDLGQILSNSVPGMSMMRGNQASNFSQTMRGRKPANWSPARAPTSPGCASGPWPPAWGRSWPCG